MSSLKTIPHTSECETVDLGGGIIGYLCQGECPAMAAFLVQPGQITGECDNQPWAQVSDAQMRKLTDAIARKMTW